MTYIDTSIGRLQCTEEEGRKVLEATKVIDNESVFVGVFVESFEHVDVSLFAFASQIIDRFSKHRADAVTYLTNEYARAPERFGGKVPVSEPIVSEPELNFFGGEKWAIRFAEGIFKICEPYGIVVEFEGQTITGFEDLSEAEEL